MGMFDLDDKATVLSDSTLALVEELRALRETKKAISAREDQVRKILLVELRDVDAGLTASGQPVIEVERQKRTRIDGDRLQALYKDAWDDCQTETSVEVLRLPEAL